MVEQILSVEPAEDHNSVLRFEIRFPKCGAVWMESILSE
jgi:hypothetical protein